VNFLPACIGGTPAHGVWANICGTDLVRDRDGTVYVLEDNRAHVDALVVADDEVLPFDEIDAHALAALGDSPPWETIRDQLADHAHEAYQYVFASPHVAGNDDVRDYALQSFPPSRPILAAAMDLTERIFRDFQFRGGVSDVYTPVSEVLAMRQGVCQDFAHLAIACLRSLGLAARYVSGYLLTRPPEGQRKLVGSDASHAWVSVFAGEAGWVDFDPTNNVIPGIEHITFAWGRDYGDVSPISGSIVGGGAHEVTVAVDVNPAPSALA
jgi:transglutaminase-like putative cysteine protease